MKQLFLSMICLTGLATTNAQNLTKYLSDAKSAYTANKLEDAHFALQQAIAEVDIITGKQVLKIVPTTMGTMTANTKDDNVFANAGFIGATMHRNWGTGTNTASLDIISNSPMIGALNTMLNTPFIGGMMNSDKSRTVKVQGYKARLNKDSDGTNGNADYTLQIPLSSALITLNVRNVTEAQALTYAGTLPLAEIAKLIQ